MKWNERGKKKKKKKSEKKEKSNWNLWCYVISFLPSYLITILLDIFFPLPTLPKTQRVILSKRIYFSLCLSFFPLALRYYRHSLDWHKFDRAVHTHSHSPFHSIRLTFGNGGRGGCRRIRDEEPTPVTRINVKKTGGVPGLYNWPPVNYTPRRASYKRKSIRHSSCQPTGVDNN